MTTIKQENFQSADRGLTVQAEPKRPLPGKGSSWFCKKKERNNNEKNGRWELEQ